MTVQSNSSIKGVSLRNRVREWMEFLKLRLEGLYTSDDFGWLWTNFTEYEGVLKEHSNLRLADAKILEIGFGARPYRLIALLSLGIDAVGIDLDAPAISGAPADFLKILRGNGFERFIKSIVRFYAFDWRQRADFAKSLSAKAGVNVKFDPVKFIVGDATSAEVRKRIIPGTFDLIFSEDVFEHIPRETLPMLMENISRWLKPEGLAIVRPNVFTGITGGHLVEWYAHPISVPRQRISEPWEHLRKKRFRANTFLNELSRADYCDLFSQHCEIIKEKVMIPDLGREFLTPSVRAELAEFSEDELFSNDVLFVLRNVKQSDE